MAEAGVVLLDFWASPFTHRVKIALAEKGVKFEAREEDLLGNKSELLLKSNPLNKQVPVLLHNGRPVNESSIIVGYIDEVWPTPPLLPQCPYERALARFWVDFIDKKVFVLGKKIWQRQGHEAEAAKKEFIETLKLLEGVLGDKDYFGGEAFGLVDLTLIPMTSWFCVYEQYGGFKVEAETPKLAAWIKKGRERKTVAACYPQSDKVLEFVRMMREKHIFH